MQSPVRMRSKSRPSRATCIKFRFPESCSMSRWQNSRKWIPALSSTPNVAMTCRQTDLGHTTGIHYVALTLNGRIPMICRNLIAGVRERANAFPLLTSFDVVPQASLEIGHRKGQPSFPPSKYFLRFGKISSGSKLSRVWRTKEWIFYLLTIYNRFDWLILFPFLTFLRSFWLS